MELKNFILYPLSALLTSFLLIPSVPYRTIFWGVPVLWWVSLGEGCCKPSPVGSRSKDLENFSLFCVLNSTKHRSRGSATTNVDESLHQKSIFLRNWGWVWDPKLVCRIQNSCGYSTDLLLLKKSLAALMKWLKVEKSSKKCAFLFFYFMFFCFSNFIN